MVNLKIENPSGRKPHVTYYPNYHPIDAFIVVYDITQRHSFEVAKKLVFAFTREARPGVLVALLGNKADLKSRREVSFKVNLICYETCVEQLYQAFDIQLPKRQTSLFQPISTTPCSPGICQQSDVGTSQVTFSQH